MRKLILHSFICVGIVFFMSTVCFGQDQEKAETGKLKSEKGLSKAEVKAKFDKSMADKKENEVKKMSQSIKSKGFKAEEDYYGTESTFEKDGKTITSSFIVQDYSKGNSKAAVCSITLSDGTNEKTYTFSLEKKGNNPDDVEEYYVDENGKVVKANSFWRCVDRKLTDICPNLDECISIDSYSKLFSCIGGSACGAGVSSWVLSCCSCDCRWWCKVVCGCCYK